MPRITAIQPESATGDAKAVFDTVKAQMGGVPNIFRTMGHAPGVLAAYLNFSSALAQGALSNVEREQISLACAGANGCDYCASAHTTLGKMAGLSEHETQLNLAGDATDAKSRALIAFVRKTVKDRAILSDKDLNNLRVAGYNDEHIVEIIANIAVNLFTNYFNHIAETEIDFPKVDAQVLRANFG